MERKWDRFVSGPPKGEESWARKFFNIILAPIKWLLYIIFTLTAITLMIGLLVFGGIFIYNAFTGGTAQAQTTKLVDVVSKTPIIAPAYNFLTQTFKIVKDPSLLERTYGFKGEVDQAQENRELGLTFSNFKSIKERFLPGETISLIASVKAMSFKEESQISFLCKDTTSEIIGAINPSEPVIIEKDTPRVFTVRCDINTESINLGEKQIQAERIILNAKYNFKTASYIPAYTMSDEKLRLLQNQDINPFVNINDPKINKNTREAISTYNYGPIRVLVNSQISQPFTEKGAFSNDPYYDLVILIEPSTLGPVYQGKLSKINNLYLYLPNNFELAEDELTNNFELVEDESEDSEFFTKYKLKQEKIKELNEQCEKYVYSPVDCESLWQRGFQLALTKFKVANLDDTDLTKNFIRAEVDYEFEAQVSKVVNIVKSLSA